MCPANGELENGDPESPVDFLCRVAHLRAYTLDLPVVPHGACEYCEGGSGYAEMMASAASLAARGPRDATTQRAKMLPMMAASAGGGCGSGGCSSCSGH
jgi:hypothetical protein